MNFCNRCGNAVIKKQPPGDDRLRYVCVHCDTIHYQNPLVVTGCLPMTAEGRVLLCRRAIEPRKNYWTLPAGFLELGETTSAGALRETWEEARAKVALNGLYRIYDLPHISQVYMFYIGELQGGFAAGEESLEVELFDEQQIPWEEIAFPVVTRALRDFFSDWPERSFSILKQEVIEPLKHKKTV